MNGFYRGGPTATTGQRSWLLQKLWPHFAPGASLHTKPMWWPLPLGDLTALYWKEDKGTKTGKQQCYYSDNLRGKSPTGRRQGFQQYKKQLCNWCGGSPATSPKKAGDSQELKTRGGCLIDIMDSVIWLYTGGRPAHVKDIHGDKEAAQVTRGEYLTQAIDDADS